MGVIDGSCTGVSYTGSVDDVLTVPTDGIFPSIIVDNFLDSAKIQLATDKITDFYGTLPKTGTSYLKARPTTSLSDNGQIPIDNIGTLEQQDETFLTGIKDEYCATHARYKFILGKLLEAISPGSNDSSNAALYMEKTITLNQRLNAMIQIMDYVAKDRVDTINGAKTIINRINETINGEQANLLATANVLQGQDGIIRTQKEMIRYTKEKNNSITNQLSLWASLNILAIGTIFYVYRNM